MADILLISESKDAPRTGALAVRFNKAGLSIRELFSTIPAPCSAAAGLLVWSEHSHYSTFFRDAARRVFRGGPALVARLTNAPPPACFGGSPSFDLSRWQGDPCDPVLDPLLD